MLNSLLLHRLFVPMIFLAVAGLGGLGIYIYDQQWRAGVNQTLQELAYTQASTLERHIFRSLSAAQMLALAVRREQGKPADFPQLAEQISEVVGGFSNLQLAPRGVITDIYPLAGNERALGLNVLTGSKDQTQNIQTQQAVLENRMILVGPFTLIQGGEAIIGRQPIFIDRGDQEEFWGLASVLIRMEALYEATNLNYLVGSGYHYQLSRTNLETGQSETFFHSHPEQRFQSGLSQSYPIRLPGSQWQLQISQPVERLWVLLLQGLMVLILASSGAWLVRYLQKEPERLRRLINAKISEVERISFRDSLTGLGNRRLLLQELEALVLQLGSDQQAALLYLDLDDFKRINDSLGHDLGDELLKKVALRLRNKVKNTDLLVRLGGDEFALLLRNVQSYDAVAFYAERIQELIARPIPLAEHQFVMKTTLGIAMLPNDGKGASELMQHADLALYSAKQQGKNTFHFYNQQMQEQAVQNMQVEEELRLALRRGELVLHFQPIFSLHTGQLQKYEALVRWQHPYNGLIYPGAFIEIAERTGLIVDMGYWVIEQSCKLLSQQLNQGQPPVKIAVNVSAAQLKDPYFIERLRTLLTAQKVPPLLLELEITESMLLDDLERAIHLLNQCRQLGLSIAIDDFGTGYSSLSQLKKLPVNTLKIDRSFVIDLDKDEEDRQIVEAVIVMAHTLQLQVVAEGIESEAQLELLKRFHCDLGQGFLLGKPHAEMRANPGWGFSAGLAAIEPTPSLNGLQR
ncbi:putative bifunctional diguanylate cyclase/phosphodiesterase [Balneatrix alpica]|uniref:putative bifunctional diguanylate cyclase/phosphodiesterase n=1 Tax=Balneatrix alpica TaxID=75684 RepID=UPI002738A467|nr:EAL domain-containing protein [Balneatrix alpica]